MPTAVPEAAMQTPPVDGEQSAEQVHMTVKEQIAVMRDELRTKGNWALMRRAHHGVNHAYEAAGQQAVWSFALAVPTLVNRISRQVSQSFAHEEVQDLIETAVSAEILSIRKKLPAWVRRRYERISKQLYNLLHVEEPEQTGFRKWWKKARSSKVEDMISLGHVWFAQWFRFWGRVKAADELRPLLAETERLTKALVEREHAHESVLHQPHKEPLHLFDGGRLWEGTKTTFRRGWNWVKSWFTRKKKPEAEQVAGDASEESGTIPMPRQQPGPVARAA